MTQNTHTLPAEVEERWNKFPMFSCCQNPLGVNSVLDNNDQLWNDRIKAFLAEEIQRAEDKGMENGILSAIESIAFVIFGIFSTGLFFDFIQYEHVGTWVFISSAIIGVTPFTVFLLWLYKIKK